MKTQVHTHKLTLLHTHTHTHTHNVCQAFISFTTFCLTACVVALAIIALREKELSVMYIAVSCVC